MIQDHTNHENREKHTPQGQYNKMFGISLKKKSCNMIMHKYRVDLELLILLPFFEYTVYFSPLRCVPILYSSPQPTPYKLKYLNYSSTLVQVVWFDLYSQTFFLKYLQGKCLHKKLLVTVNIH